MKIMNHITAGNPRKLVKPIVYTTVANLAAILPFALLAAAARAIFEPFVNPGEATGFAWLWWICGAMVGTMLLIYLLEIPAYRSQFRGAYTVAAEGRAALAEHLRKLSLGFLNRRDPGDLANMMMGDFTLVEHGVSHLVPQMIGAVLMPIVALGGLAFLDWSMAIAMFAAFPVAVLLLWLTERFQRKLGASHMAAKRHASNRLQEYLNGIRVIKAYKLSGERFTRLDQAFKELMRQSIRLEGLLGPVVLLAIVLVRAGLTIMTMAGVYFLVGGSLDVLVFVTFLLIGTRIFDPLTSALVNYAEFKYHAQAGERIVKLLQEPAMQGKLAPEGDASIAFDQVTFGYTPGKPTLKKVSAELPSGTLTAIVGPSGSGKSTMLRLIARFYDPDQGEVTLGGQNMRELNPEALLQQVSMVFQDVYLFQDTIGNNIRFGRSGAAQEEVERAAREACCHDFIMGLPQGYDTMVGEGGSTLSGGEKQRISIARAILKNAPIVLLDEATASLDPENESHIQQAIDRLIQGRTVVVVAHRLKTIRNADQIIVLEAGQVAERGRHEELLAAGGLYARLWNRQQETSGWKITS